MLVKRLISQRQVPVDLMERITCKFDAYWRCCRPWGYWAYKGPTFTSALLCHPRDNWGAMKFFASVAVLQTACWCILLCLQTPGSQYMYVRLFNCWNEIWNWTDKSGLMAFSCFGLILGVLLTNSSAKTKACTIVGNVNEKRCGRTVVCWPVVVTEELVLRKNFYNGDFTDKCPITDWWHHFPILLFSSRLQWKQIA